MKKLIILIGLMFIVSCASDSGFTDPYTTFGSPDLPGASTGFADPYTIQ